MCIYIYIHVCVYIYIYIYACICIYHLLPLIIPPLIKTNLGGNNICYYQFRRRHDYPPHKKKHDFWFDLPPS